MSFFIRLDRSSTQNGRVHYADFKPAELAAIKVSLSSEEFKKLGCPETINVAINPVTAPKED